MLTIKLIWHSKFRLQRFGDFAEITIICFKYSRMYLNNAKFSNLKFKILKFILIEANT